MFQTHLEAVHISVVAIVHLLLHCSQVHHILLSSDNVEVTGEVLRIDGFAEQVVLRVSPALPLPHLRDGSRHSPRLAFATRPTSCSAVPVVAS